MLWWHTLYWRYSYINAPETPLTTTHMISPVTQVSSTNKIDNRDIAKNVFKLRGFSQGRIYGPYLNNNPFLTASVV